MKQRNIFFSLTSVIFFTMVFVIIRNNNSFRHQLVIPHEDDDHQTHLLEKHSIELSLILEKLNNLENVKNQVDSNQCEAVKSVAFAKTHKTGSSTVQNIFLRYSVQNDLTVAFPPNSWMFSVTDSFNSAIVLDGPFKNLGFDMFVSHSKWTHSEVEKVLPKAKYVTILRDPVNCFESNYVFMGAQKAHNMDINGYAKKFAHQDIQRNPKSYVGRNNLLWDLGMEISDMHDVNKVKEYIEEIDSYFDMVLILEHLDESLVLLKDKFCWTLDDVTYINQLERIEEKRTFITNETRTMMTDWLWADYLLYNHFLNKLKMQIDQYGKEKMEESVKDLKIRNQNIIDSCILRKAEKPLLSGKGRKGVEGVFGVETDSSKPWCWPYTRRETEFAKMIREYQYKKVEKLDKLRGINAQE